MIRWLQPLLTIVQTDFFPFPSVGPVPNDSSDVAEGKLLVTDLDSLFKLFDKGGNGRITLSKMSAAASALGCPFEAR